MASELRIGLIGLDTSHVPAFTRNLNNPDDAEHLAGARVVAGYPGGSKDFELSIGRVEKITAEVRDQFGVKILASPEAIAEAVDLVFINAVDGRTHLNYLKSIARFKKPTFIDKPIALDSSDAREMFKIARENGFPLMSCSSLRYSDALTDYLDSEHEEIFGCDIYGPLQIQPTQPGWFWYGIHMMEIANRVMGRGCRQISVVKNSDYDLLAGIWADGRIVAMRGHRKGHGKFGITIHGESKSVFLDLSNNRRSYYSRLLEAILRSLPNGKSDVDPADTLEIVHMIEAANIARDTGQRVDVEEVRS